MKKQVITALTVVAMVGICSADILLSSGFDGNTGAVVLPGNTDNASGSATVGITDWTTDASVTAISGLTAISPGAGFAQLQGGGAAYAGPNNLYVNNNHNSGAGDRGYSLSFTIDTSWDLTNLNVLSAHSNNQGTQDQAFNSDLVFVLSDGGGVVATATSPQAYLTDAIPYHSVDFDLTGTTIGAGTYTLEVYQNNFVGGGAYAVYDGVTLEAIPEPATLGLIGLFGGSLFVIRRKFMI